MLDIIIDFIYKEKGMKKFFQIILISIITISSTLILFLNTNVYLNKKNNEEFLTTYNNIFIKDNLTYSEQLVLPKIEMNRKDYIGVINLNVPTQSNCNSLYININSCLYSSKPFIIMTFNLEGGFNHYKNYDINSILTFTNTLGNIFKYKIKNIKRINKLSNVNNYNEDLIIIIKDYYNLEYILFICELD